MKETCCLLVRHRFLPRSRELPLLTRVYRNFPGPMYTGAGPYDASQGRPAMAGVSRSSSTRSSKYAAASGGYVPSHVLQQQYGVSYVPNK